MTISHCTELFAHFSTSKVYLKMSRVCFNCKYCIGPEEASSTVTEELDISKVHFFHQKCFNCVECAVPLSVFTAIVPYRSNLLLCPNHFDVIWKKAPICPTCGNKCLGECKISEKIIYHPDCDTPSQSTSSFCTIENLSLDFMKDATSEILPSWQPNLNPEPITDDGNGSGQLQPAAGDGDTKIFTLQKASSATYSQYNGNYFPTMPLKEEMPPYHHLPVPEMVPYQQQPIQPLQQNYSLFYQQQHTDGRENQQQQPVNFDEMQSYFFRLPESTLAAPQNFPHGDLAAKNFQPEPRNVYKLQQPNFQFPAPDNIQLQNQVYNLVNPSTNEVVHQITIDKHQHTLTKKVKSESPKCTRRQRATITPNQKYILEEAWSNTKFPNRQQRNNLGVRTGLDQRQVQIWFQNMRSKEKKDSESVNRAV